MVQSIHVWKNDGTVYSCLVEWWYSLFT